MLSDIHSGMMDVRFFLRDFIYIFPLFSIIQKRVWRLCGKKRIYKWNLWKETLIWMICVISEESGRLYKRRDMTLKENIFILSKGWREAMRCVWCVMCVSYTTMRWRKKLLFQQLFVLLTIWFIIRALTYIEDRIQK